MQIQVPECIEKPVQDKKKLRGIEWRQDEWKQL